jgi:hypothetical protein
MRHYHDWKVVLWDLDGAPHVAGHMDAVRSLAWFRWLHGWWSKQTISGREGIRLELWRGKRQVISLVIHMAGLLVAQHAIFLVWVRHWMV